MSSKCFNASRDKMFQYLKRKNVSIPQEEKCFNSPMSYSTDVHFYNPSVKIGSTSFFSSSDMQKFHNISGCQAIGINSSLVFF